MLWNSLRFVDELDRCGNRYEIENQWYSKAAWGDRNRYVLNAWRLYRCANRSALGMLILGTAKIRKDASLVGNFGFTSAGGLSDPEEQKLVQKLDEGRTAVTNAPTVLGQGSVLNDQNWTPLLNDAFIMGGIHAQHEFHIAEDSLEQYVRFVDARAVFEKQKAPSKSAAELWQGYFTQHPESLWMNGAPRVLARELIGLKTFGYRPQFFPQQLSFACADPDRALNANFVKYLDGVEAAHYRSGSARAVFDAVSEFLFGHAWVEPKFERFADLGAKPA